MTCEYSISTIMRNLFNCREDLIDKNYINYTDNNEWKERALKNYKFWINEFESLLKYYLKERLELFKMRVGDIYSKDFPLMFDFYESETDFKYKLLMEDLSDRKDRTKLTAWNRSVMVLPGLGDGSKDTTNNPESLDQVIVIMYRPEDKMIDGNELEKLVTNPILEKGKGYMISYNITNEPESFLGILDALCPEQITEWIHDNGYTENII